jgi:MFS transporter, PAT family, beta-lactamase induction signal transducer AmpG
MQATISSTDAERVPFWSALIRDRRIAPALGLGFTSGMPFLLTYSTQSAWLTDAGVPLATIGLLSELTLAYKFKFVWAPFLDQYDPPLIGRVLGRRRGWLLVAILAVMVMLTGISFGDPGHWIWWTVGFSFALGIAGATLDLVLDGWRITSVRPPEKQAVLSSWTEIGWRLGNLAAGAGALYLADRIGWKGAYLCMAALMLVGIVATLFAPEPPSDMEPHKPHAGFVETIWAPIHDLLKRLGPMAVAILLLVAGFRMPGYIASAMAVPLFKHQGFTNTDIATVTKVVGFWIALGGTFMAGWLIPRIGMMSPYRHGRGLGLASRARAPCGARRGWRQGVLDFRAGRRRRGLCLRLRVDRAHHLHVDARVSGACGEPIWLADLALRLSGQHSGRVLGLRDRAYRLRMVLHLDLAHRHPGRAAGGLCMVPRRDIGRGADPGRRRALAVC